MDLACVDKSASQNNGVKNLLVALDIFSRFVGVQTMKTKYAKDNSQAFKKLFLDKTFLKNFGLINEQNMGEISKILQRQ